MNWLHLKLALISVSQYIINMLEILYEKKIESSYVRNIRIMSIYVYTVLWIIRTKQKLQYL